MERMQFVFDQGRPADAGASAVLVGVVSSGNLEVLVEQTELNGACAIEVSTPVAGYDTIWRAVLEDFFDRHRIGNLRLSINDMGATPAVVSLRLDQAVEEFRGATP